MKSLFDNYRNLILFPMGILSLKLQESYDKLVNSYRTALPSIVPLLFEIYQLKI